MVDLLQVFERIARTAHRFSEGESYAAPRLHPFDTRNIHPRLPPKVKKLFDDGHYAEATFEAFKFIDKRVGYHAKMKESGFKLMMTAFDEGKPAIILTPMKGQQ